MQKDTYSLFLQNNKKHAEDYYKKSLQKTQQQIMLENLLLCDKNIDENLPYKIADLGCGGGTLSFHLNKIFKNATFSLLDYNQNAIDIAKEINSGDNFEFNVGSIFELPFDDNSFDMVFCWQLLLIFNIDDFKKALYEMLRILKPGGKFYASSLFNFEHNVDISSSFYDNTLIYEENQRAISYNTYSLQTIDKILQNKVKFHKIHEFISQIDFPRTAIGGGIGTYTQKILQDDGSIKRLQISGGMLMSWGILEIKK